MPIISGSFMAVNDNQGSPLRDVGLLSGRQDQAQRVAQCVDTGVDLGGQSAPRAADRLIATVFLERRPNAGAPERSLRR